MNPPVHQTPFESTRAKEDARRTHSAQSDPNAHSSVRLGGRPVMILCHYFWPEEMATSAMVSGVAFELGAKGVPILAIAGHPAYWSGASELAPRGGKLPALMTRAGVSVRRVWSTRLDKNRTLGRALNTATFTLSTIWAALRAPRLRAIIAVTNPPLLLWAAALVGRLRSVPYILLIHDVYPQIATAMGKIKPGSWIDRLWGALNRWSYRGADRIIALGECMAQVLRAEIPAGQAGKVVVIPNWADGDFIKPLPRANHPKLVEWGLEGAFVAQYSGNIGLFHDIQTLIDAARILKDRAARGDQRGANITLLLIGEGAQSDRVRSALENEGLDRVKLQPFQPGGALPLTLTACDVSLVTLKREATGLCVPSKLYGQLAAGRPILCVADKASETSRTVVEGHCGIAIEPGDAEALADALIRLSEDSALAERMGAAARRVFEERFTLAAVAAGYDALLGEYEA